MKLSSFILVFLLTGAAFATEIELQPGGMIKISAGDTATIKCEGASSPVGGQGTVSAFCINGDDLVISIDGVKKEDSLTIDLLNDATCKKAIATIKPKLGDFTGVKSFSFCDDDDLIKVKVTSDGTISSTSIDTNNNAECLAAIN